MISNVTDYVGIQDDPKLVLRPVCRSQNNHKNRDLHVKVIPLICYWYCCRPSSAVCLLLSFVDWQKIQFNLLDEKTVNGLYQSTIFVRYC